MRALAPFVLGLVGAVFLPERVQAANEPRAASDSEVESIEEIVVVGSRIARSNLDSPSPVLVFDASELKASGITTIGEFSRFLPQNAAITSPGFLAGSPLRGTSGFNLRGIGLDATLTLVNGRRIAPYGSSGGEEPFVDINAIPVAAIDRIEILTDGASAIYGSEAVAGVVNIVLKRTIEGITAEGGFLTTSEGDGDEWDLSLTGGWNNADTTVTGTLSWFDQGLIWSRDRDWSSTVDMRDRGGFDYGNYASSPPSMYLVESRVLLADPACPEDSPSAHLVVYVPGKEEVCNSNYWHFTSLQQPSERLGVTASLRHDFSATTAFFAEFIGNRSEVESTVAPTVLLDYFVSVDHPNNPYGEDLFIEYRALDNGNREFLTESNTWRLVAGVEWSWGAWDWEAALTESEAKSDQTRFNDVLIDPFQAALLGEGGPNGNQYYNPFGLNPLNPPEVITEFSISGTHVRQTAEERTVDLQVSGSFGKLPGGPVGAAFGGQFRQQSVDQSADEEELTGVMAGSAGFEPLSEESDIYSVFAEFVLPVLPSVEAQLAVRLDDYSDFGSTTNPKIGLGWRPVETWLLRGTWGTSFRPPTFTELYDPTVQFEDVFFEDPWRCPATGDFTDCRFNPVISEFSGNPDLEPDEGETWLLGFAWEPGGISGLSISLDYWSIEHTNRIMPSWEQFLFETLPPDENPFIIRAPQTAEDLALGIPGVIIGGDYTYINADTVTTDGIDFNLAYEWESAAFGVFSSGISYTYLNEYKTGISFHTAQIERDVAGLAALGSPWPQHRGNLHLDWSRGNHGASAVLHYSGSFHSPYNWVVDDRETDVPFSVDDYWQPDLQYSYRFTGLKGAELRVGCRNCLGQDPPDYNYAVPGEFFHEGRGALLYARWTQSFK